MTQENTNLEEIMMAEVVPAPSLGIDRMVMITKVAPKTPPVQDHQGALEIMRARLAGGRPRTSIRK